MDKKIYFDHNSATDYIVPSLEELKNSLNLDSLSFSMNPSSQHFYGRQAKKILEELRSQFYELLGINRLEQKIVFTSSGTESNHIMIQYARKSGIPFLGSEIEHSSIYLNTDVQIPVDSEGQIDIDVFKKVLETINKDALKHQEAIILRQNSLFSGIFSVIHANNETGIVQRNITKLREICDAHKILLHSDCSQSIGRVDVDFSRFSAATFSSHKIGGPRGISALVMNIDVLEDIVDLKGGGQEYGVKSGTENIKGVAEFLYALKHRLSTMKEYVKHTSYLRDRLELGVTEVVSKHLLKHDSTHKGKDLEQFNAKNYSNSASFSKSYKDNDITIPHLIIGKDIERISNTSMIVTPGHSSELQVIRLDMKGICISGGSACYSGSSRGSYVLKNMGIIGHEDCIRISLALSNTMEEVEHFIKVWHSIFGNI